MTSTSDLRALWEKTTKGLWSARTIQDGYDALWVEVFAPSGEIAVLGSPQRIEDLEADAAFIATAHREWPALMDKVEELERLKAAMADSEAAPGCWQPLETAPKDRLIEVYAPAAHGLDAMISLCAWHEDAGFCICELRSPSHWRPHSPPSGAVLETAGVDGECTCPEHGSWIAADDINRMVKELDDAMNGDGAAPHPKFCDIFDQLLKRVSNPLPGQPSPYIEGYFTDRINAGDRPNLSGRASGASLLKQTGDAYGPDKAALRSEETSAMSDQPVRGLGEENANALRHLLDLHRGHFFICPSCCHQHDDHYESLDLWSELERLASTPQDGPDQPSREEPLAAENERLWAAVTQAIAWFDDYEQQHLAKSPPDTVKATTNAERARTLRLALHAREEPINPSDMRVEEIARLREALEACKQMIDVALPCFDWGKSALSAEAIRLLNETPGKINAALLPEARAILALQGARK